MTANGQEEGMKMVYSCVNDRATEKDKQPGCDKSCGYRNEEKRCGFLVEKTEDNDSLAYHHPLRKGGSEND